MSRVFRDLAVPMRFNDQNPWGVDAETDADWYLFSPLREMRA